jgi:hypothetical protein
MTGQNPEIRAFSSEVDAGSRQENVLNQKPGAPFRFDRNGKGSRLELNARRLSGIVNSAAIAKTLRQQR